MKRSGFSRIRVLVSPRDRRFGWLIAGHMRVRCALGRLGPTRRKREGDGATPIGSFALLQLFYRPDKGPRPRTLLPTRTISPDDGWCDAPQDRAYNTPVKRPYPASHEEMWREDDMYDLVLDIDYNRGRGGVPGRPLRLSSMSNRHPFPMTLHVGVEGDGVAKKRLAKQGRAGIRRGISKGIRKGKGSAIFMHIARPGFTPTAGCVALRKDDLRRLLPHLGPQTHIVIA